MQTHTTADIRQLFLDFFTRHDHAKVKSASLIPANDPTLMFNNAGMVQFKDVFVGAEKRPYTRATSSQKCMRVSGKHNDLSEVGRTARHHTFFEMLGNFSFGDYFKAGAIEMAWELLIDELGFARDRIWVTVFGGAEGVAADDEARELWKKIAGLPDERILAFGMKDNFWAMGDTGPCGPCTEIHFDQGGPHDPEPTPGDFETGRVVEVWNNVFMQFERQASGELVPLPKPSVDTGMGLERLAAVVQGVRSNYDIDLFAPIIAATAALAGKKYGSGEADDDISLRVIADHARATAFLVADGVQPGNEGRGYVMRRIMRRAIRHGRRLGFDEIFFDQACLQVVEQMGEAYPELRESKTLIQKVAALEEASFRRTLDTGLGILDREIAVLRERGAREIPGTTVFKLYDTFGFPKDLTAVIGEEHGLAVDDAGFAQEMEAQRARSRGGAVGEEAVAGVYKALKEEIGAVRFIGYAHEDEPLADREGEWRLFEHDGIPHLETRCTVRALVRNGTQVDAAGKGEVEVVLEPTPFYGESGGQIGDRGVVTGDGGLEIVIAANHKPLEDLTVASGTVRAGEVTAGQRVWAGYDPRVRKLTRAHHSATHLLHGALRSVLGDHVKQSGSLVDPKHLRFDYSHFEAPSARELRAVEDDANRRVRGGHPVVTEVMAFDDAKHKGAIAFFGDKYGDVVRVVTMGESVEFCGGTHAKSLSEIGLILITKDEAIASGVRRIEAQVGAAAEQRTRETVERLVHAAAILNGESEAVPEEAPILQAVLKAVRQRAGLRQELEGLGIDAGAAAEVVKAPTLAADFGLAPARLARDAWQGLVLLANARGADVEAIADGLLSRDPDLDPGGLLRGLARLQSGNRDLERRLQEMKSSQLGSQVGDLMASAKDVGGVKLLTAALVDVEPKALREMADRLRDQLGSGIVALVAANDAKAALLVAVTSDLTGRFAAGTLVKELAPIIGGRGGGKPQLAQAGGNKPGAAAELFERLEEMVSQSP